MIRLSRVTKEVGIGARKRVLIDNASIDIPTNDRIALLGRSGVGKSMLLYMLAGLEPATSGTIERFVRVSLPVGYGRAFKVNASPAQNAEFFARCYGAQPKEVVEFIDAVAELREYLQVPLRTLPPDLRVRFAFALGYALPFDVYLIDNTPMVGTKDFRDRCLGMLAMRAKTAGVLFATSEPRIAKRYCRSAIVLHNAKLTYVPTIDDAIEMIQEAPADFESEEP